MAHEVAKRAAAVAALAWVESGRILGVGTGSTVAHFIDALASDGPGRPLAAVATSRDTEERLGRAGISAVTLEQIEPPLYLYVDGADEVDASGRAIKGGGGAHVLEKKVARSSTLWVCIVDEGKLVKQLGRDAPVPLEVNDDDLERMVAAVRALGGDARPREGFSADSGNPILDVHGLDLSNAGAMEEFLERIPGVVGSGLFVHRRADVVLVGHDDGRVETIKPF